MSKPEDGTDQTAPAVTVHNRTGRGAALIVCEHASNFIPAEYGDLGVSPEQRDSHIAWDPGALPVAKAMSARLDAPLVAGGISRLLFDCNRPPEAPDAIPEKSEIHDIPGNMALDQDSRAKRVRDIHDPFHKRLSETLATFGTPPVIITVHSFTPIYKGKTRDVEIGLLHDADDRLAKAMLNQADNHTHRRVRLNDPYGAEHGVTHTLRTYALPIGAINVMLEIRNDLIRDAASQSAMAALLAGWIIDACADLDAALTLAETV